MNTSSNEDVRKLYDETANSYSSMMDQEIQLPVYSDILSRLSKNISCLNGPLLDVSCGSGHMLKMYHEKYDHNRELIGIDLSPAMIDVSKERVTKFAKFHVGDMSKLDDVPSGIAAALINFFAIHHLNNETFQASLCEWCRVTQSKGQLVLAAWEGTGAIDYGESSDVVALKHDKETLKLMILDAGYHIDQLKIDFIDEMEMNAVYIEATKL